jgi:signal transduction histidine kinase
MPLQQDGSRFLSTLPPSRAAHRLAAGTVILSALLTLVAAPFAKVQLAPVPAFLPAYESALIVCELITAVLLFGQFGLLRERALLFLGSAYLLSAIMAAAHMLSFPGLFAPAGVLGGGPQTTAWIYFLWHAAFPLLVMGYALSRRAAAEPAVAEPAVAEPMARPGAAMLAAIALTVAAALLLVLAATAGRDALPDIMLGNRDAPAKFLVAFPTWCLCVVALALLLRGRRRSVMDLWIMVVMWVWIFDIALASVLNAGRFDLGWYMGRVYGFAAGSFVLVLMLLENSVLHARLAAAHRGLGELNRELESFSYSVSHDLRRPLRAVDGFARMLEEDYAGSLDAEGMRLLTVIRTEAGHMGDMINDLLAFSHLGRQAVNASDFDTRELVEVVIATLRAEAGATRFVCTALPRSHGDPALLRQVWTNLLANAVKYSGKRAEPVVEVGAHADGGFDVFYVRDNGAGFDMRFYDKLFGVFQRLHGEEEFPGTGIGLAIVQRVVSRHGGKVWAAGKVDGGATFFFSLPRSSSNTMAGGAAGHGVAVHGTTAAEGAGFAAAPAGSAGIVHP